MSICGLLRSIAFGIELTVDNAELEGAIVGGLCRRTVYSLKPILYVVTVRRSLGHMTKEGRFRVFTREDGETHSFHCSDRYRFRGTCQIHCN